MIKLNANRMNTMKNRHILASLFAVLVITTTASASIDSLWSSPSSAGTKGQLVAPGSSRVDYYYAFDSTAGVCRIYDPDDFSLLYTVGVGTADAYTYLWYQYLNDASGNGHPEVVLYHYNTITYCYSVSILDMSSGVLKSWSSASYSYFPKFVAPTPGSTMLKFGIERNTGMAGRSPSILMVYSLGISAAVAADDTPSAPRVPMIALEQSRPNPMSDQAVIEFSLPRLGRASIDIYNQLGQLVMTLADRAFPAGRSTVRFDGRGLAAGAYFYRLQTQDGQDIRKLVLVK